ncbi:hypothetical protein RvY_16046 [Ramazzottius varieornatus]|uniref:Uncharacterized protein n=1 Tax=Ramazzottius varieornatus TaxID=947166 RepID=A0A1D1W019_RAMVA|nr:hypothetical protein RvY_16046 [Ramazzottius varieornatus]
MANESIYNIVEALEKWQSYAGGSREGNIALQVPGFTLFLLRETDGASQDTSVSRTEA